MSAGLPVVQAELREAKVCLGISRQKLKLSFNSIIYKQDKNSIYLGGFCENK